MPGDVVSGIARAPSNISSGLVKTVKTVGRGVEKAAVPAAKAGALAFGETGMATDQGRQRC